MIYNQNEFDIKFEWGLKGIEQLLPVSDVLIIVDVLSFSTSVDIATSNGAIIYPYRWKDTTAALYAQSLDAQLADFNRAAATGYSLSPSSLGDIPAGIKLVLPSPNGSTLTLATGRIPTFCGCLRNANAVAKAAGKVGNRIGLIAAGEQWDDLTLRPAIEDLIGAGAIISFLSGKLSPESSVALAAYNDLRTNLKKALCQSSSGKELIARGYVNDIELAGMLNVSDTAPLLVNGAYMSIPG